MKAYPILFSGPMVRAIRDGKKSQTRRLVRVDPALPIRVHGRSEDLRKGREGVVFEHLPPGCAPMGHPGEDPKFVRYFPYGKTGATMYVKETHALVGPARTVVYRADMGDHSRVDHWIPSIFMPRALSRIDLRVDAWRVERLHEISEADARREGLPNRPSFLVRWDELNGLRCPVETDPWVWVVDFAVVRKPEA